MRFPLDFFTKEDKDLHKKLTKRAKEEDKSLQKLIKEILKKGL